jgi:hypothetical protein
VGESGEELRKSDEVRISLESGTTVIIDQYCGDSKTLKSPYGG